MKNFILLNNSFALGTLSYIWSHPNCQQQRTESILKFVGWQFYKRITGRFVDLQLIPGVTIRCHPDSRSSAAVLYCGLYDYNEMNFLLRYLHADDSFIDVGANIGVYTLLAASIIQSGSIYSFEALPKNYERLKENLQLNQFRQVKPYAIAISDHSGSVALNIAEGDSMPFITSVVTNSTVTVPTDTLNHLLKTQPYMSLTLGKMDIEGAEILALKGSTSLLQKQKPPVWILEINDAVNNFGYQRQDIPDFLKEYGYSLYTYNADSNQIFPITLEEQQGNNVLAIADSSIDFVHNRLNNN
jgi:FkbM family methyltransferase